MKQASLKMIHTDSDVAFGTVGCIIVSVACGRWLDATAERFCALMEAQVRREGMLVTLAVAEVGARAPDGEARQRFAAANQACSGSHQHSAIVIEGGAFRLAVTRSVLTSLNLLGRRRPNEKICGDTAEAAAWLVQQLGTSAVCDVAGLVSAVATVRAAMRGARGTGASAELR